MKGNKLVFIMGYAGSGTRVITKILKGVGFWVGDDDQLNNYVAGEPYDFIPLQRITQRTRGVKGGKLPLKEFRGCVENNAQKHERVALKDGNIMLFLPDVYSLFPDAKYILMARNGLDQILGDYKMAEVCAPNWLSPKEMEMGFFEKRIIFWNKVYRFALDFAQQHEDQFLVVKLEDLCDNPGSVIDIILRFVGVQPLVDLVDKERAHIGRRFTSQDVGGHYYDSSSLQKLEQLGEETLKRLKYL